MILNYGVGNIFSITTALRRLGVEVEVDSRARPGEFDALVLPGVGGFTAAAESIAPYREELKSWIRSGIPTLGICLGMQIFFESSQEGPGEGLRLLDGRVVALPKQVKSPQMGWNRIRVTNPTTLLEGADGAWVYFNHSYYPKPVDERVVAATTSYGLDIPCVVADRHIYGTQFHPEKSSTAGEKILQNFIHEIRR